MNGEHLPSIKMHFGKLIKSKNGNESKTLNVNITKSLKPKRICENQKLKETLKLNKQWMLRKSMLKMHLLKTTIKSQKVKE